MHNRMEQRACMTWNTFFYSVLSYLFLLFDTHTLCVQIQCNDRAAGECHTLCVVQCNWSVYPAGTKTVIEWLVVKVCNLFLCPSLQPRERKTAGQRGSVMRQAVCVMSSSVFLAVWDTKRQTGEKAWWRKVSRWEYCSLLYFQCCLRDVSDLFMCPFTLG